MLVTVVAILYQEADYEQTRRCLHNFEYVKILEVDRQGYGSLAKAINKGMRCVTTEFAWIVTNVVFSTGTLVTLQRALEQTKHAAVTPVFASDHKANRFIPGAADIREVPFVEFTAPMVRTEIFKQFPLDEDMPYWGHDLDFGHRLREAGHTLAVAQQAEVEHTYIRFNTAKNPITDKRKLFRTETNYSTEAALIKKYGNEWKRVTGYL